MTVAETLDEIGREADVALRRRLLRVLRIGQGRVGEQE